MLQYVKFFNVIFTGYVNRILSFNFDQHFGTESLSIKATRYFVLGGRAPQAKLIIF